MFEPITFMAKAAEDLAQRIQYLYPHSRECAQGADLQLIDAPEGVGVVLHVRPEVMQDASRLFFTQRCLADALEDYPHDKELHKYLRGRVEMSAAALALSVLDSGGNDPTPSQRPAHF